MVEVIFSGFSAQDKKVSATVGDTLLRVAHDNNIKLPSLCQEGDCGTCVVRVKELTPKPAAHHMEEREIKTLIELKHLTRDKAEELQLKQIAHNIRLACQCIVRGDMEVRPME